MSTRVNPPLSTAPGPDRLRDERLLPNATLVARREFGERVRSRLFVVSTLLLSLLAVVVSLTPVLIKFVDRGTTTTIAIVSNDEAVAERTIATMGYVLNTPDSTLGKAQSFRFVRLGSGQNLGDEVGQGHYDAGLQANRTAAGGIDFQFITGEAIGADRIQTITVAAWAVAIFDWTNANNGRIKSPFVIPNVDVIAGAGPTVGGQPLPASDYAARRIIGVVFVVLIFITLVIYGMWVAAAVVAEKSSRVMEMLISAASPKQLVIGKVAGIGLAGLVQYAAILIPALVMLLLEDRVSVALFGSTASLGLSASVLSPGLLLAYGGYWILGFILYSLVYAAAGSLVSRAEDLQVLALPLSLIAIVGYLQAVLALSGGITPVMRVASFVPFWSPFVMLTRLAVGRVEPWEVGLSFVLLVAGIFVVGVVAVRVYSAGVLLYGQRPGFRAIAGAILRPTA